MGQTFGRCRRGLDTLLLLLLIWLLHPTATVTTTASTTTASTNTAAQPPPRVELEYLVVGVSGGLQDGFPERPKMDYHAGQADESKAIFLGRALVRGYKAYLDVMQQGWRQYVHEPDQPYINCNVFATGCHEHANEYWIYLIDTRQVIAVLNNEPRFLSITPDTGLLDLTVADYDYSHNNNKDDDDDDDSASASFSYYYQTVAKFMRGQIARQNKSDTTAVAVPLVTAVYFHAASHVPSPPIRHLQLPPSSSSPSSNGSEDMANTATTTTIQTAVTNFPQSLALWAGVNDADRTAIHDAGCCGGDDNGGVGLCTAVAWATAQQAERRYWDGIRAAVRAAEQNRPSTTPRNATATRAAGGPSSDDGPQQQQQQQQPRHHLDVACQETTRFGASPDTARVNAPLTASALQQALADIGCTVDFRTGTIRPVTMVVTDVVVADDDEASVGGTSQKTEL